MSARNETIIVNRQDKDGDLTWDSYRAIRWLVGTDGTLLLFAARKAAPDGGILVAQYPPGQWMFVQRQREIT